VSVVEVAVERRVLKEGVPALAKLTMWLWAWGLMMLLTLFCRAVFGTVEGTVGWIPFAGRLLKSPIHRIEQKVSHIIGGAVRPIDKHIATHWHSLAQIVRSIPSQLVDDAGLLFGLAAALVLLPSTALVKLLIRLTIKPLITNIHTIMRWIHHLRAETRVIEHTVTHTIAPRVKVIEHDVAHVITHDLPYAGAAARAAEDRAISTYKWLAKHRSVFLTGVFTGAVAWALSRVGGSWIRCKNWREIGKRVCRVPWPVIEGLLGLLAIEIALHDLRRTTQLAEEALEFVTGLVWDAAAIGDRPRGQFTIE
jgi:hypothetical protein